METTSIGTYEGTSWLEPFESTTASLSMLEMLERDFEASNDVDEDKWKNIETADTFYTYEKIEIENEDMWKNYIYRPLTIYLPGITGIFGMVTNLINIIVYIRMGVFKEVINLSFSCLSLADFLFMLSMAISSMLRIPSSSPKRSQSNAAINWVVIDNCKLTFTALTCWVTAFIAFQRCISVTLPFKAKFIFTTRRCAFMLMALLIAVPLTYIPAYEAYYLKSNGTFVAIYPPVLSDKKYNIAVNLEFANSFVHRGLPMIVVLTCNIIIYMNVKRSQRWRQTTTIPNKRQLETSGGEASRGIKATPKMPTKEQRLIKMIMVISAMFVICYTPKMLIKTLEHMYANLPMFDPHYYEVTYKSVFVIEGINSSCNIFVFYFMSVNYRSAIRKCKGRSE